MHLLKAVVFLTVLTVVNNARAQTTCVRPSVVGGHITAGHYVTGVTIQHVSDLLAPPPTPGRYTTSHQIEEAQRRNVERRARVLQALLGTLNRLGLAGDGGALTLEEVQARICGAFGLESACDLELTERRVYTAQDQGDPCAYTPEHRPSGRGTCSVATVIPTGVMVVIERDVIHVSSRPDGEAEYVTGVCVPPRDDAEALRREPAVDPVWARTRYAELRQAGSRTGTRRRR